MSSAAYERPQTMGTLRDYVTGTSRMQQAAESTVVLHITHNHLKARFPEIRLDMHVSVAAAESMRVMRRACSRSRRVWPGGNGGRR